MKDCTTFLKLQEAAMSKQAEAKRQGYEGNTTTCLQVNKEIVELLKIKNSQTRDAITTEDMFRPKGTSQQ
jgi:hypothetical protein